MAVSSQSQDNAIARRDEMEKMTVSSTLQDSCDHFAYCVQVLGGTTASSRRLGIDERAIRRFINGERPLSIGLLKDTAKALRQLATEAEAAQGHIAAILGSQPNDPQTPPV